VEKGRGKGKIERVRGRDNERGEEEGKEGDKQDGRGLKRGRERKRQMGKSPSQKIDSLFFKRLLQIDKGTTLSKDTLLLIYIHLLNCIPNYVRRSFLVSEKTA